MKLTATSAAAALLLAAGITSGACAGGPAKVISAQEAKSRMDADRSVIVLDVRTPEEYAEKHIPGSVLLPLDTIERDAPKALPDKKRTILVYCRSGRRSAIAAKTLADMGYLSVFDFGGINRGPYATVSGK